MSPNGWVKPRIDASTGAYNAWTVLVQIWLPGSVPPVCTACFGRRTNAPPRPSLLSMHAVMVYLRCC